MKGRLRKMHSTEIVIICSNIHVTSLLTWLNTCFFKATSLSHILTQIPQQCSPLYWSHRKKSTHGVGTGASGFPLSAVCCTSLNPSSLNVNQPKSLAASQVYQAVIITICVNIGQRPDDWPRVEGGRSVRTRRIYGGRLLSVASI
jgi:hypothetical protein